MLVIKVHRQYMQMVALRRRKPGPPPGRPASTRSNMGPRTTAVNKLRYSTESRDSRFPADRRGDQDMGGSHLATTFFSPRLRLVQHFT